MEPHGDQPLVTAGPPLAQSGAAMILVHGRNAAPRNIIELAQAHDPAGFTLLAPAAAGNTWYPHSFMAETESNEPGLSSGLAVLRRVLDDTLAAGVPRERVLLMGFSQGACLTAEFAVRNAGRFGGVIIYSGGLIGPPGRTWDYPGSFDGAPVFLGCSDVDSHVPKTRVEESAAVFARMGATVEMRIYPGMPHTVIPDEMAYTKALMASILRG